MIATILISFGIYLIVLFRKTSKLRRELTEAESELLDEVEEALGIEALELLLERKSWKGMPKYLLYYFYGRPDEVKTVESLDFINETWYFKPIENARSNARRRHQIEIYIENHLVTNSSVETTNK